MIRLLPVVLLILAIAACDRPKEKPLGDCLMSAVAFYAKGGQVFDEKGCSVETGSYTGTCDFSGGPMHSSTQGSDRCVTITARDVHDGRNRDLTVRLPVESLVPEKVPEVAGEFDSFVGTCIVPTPKEEAAKNPLLKCSQATESPCQFVNLKVNDVPGFNIYSTRHVYFSFTSMEMKGK